MEIVVERTMILRDRDSNDTTHGEKRLVGAAKFCYHNKLFFIVTKI